MVNLYCPYCKSKMILIFESINTYKCVCSSWWNCDKKYNLWKIWRGPPTNPIDGVGWRPVQKEEMPIDKQTFIFR